MGEQLSPLGAFRAALKTGAIDPVTAMVEAQRSADVSAAGDGSGNTYLHRDAAASIRAALALAGEFPDADARPPLYGVPVSVKDCFDQAGTVTTCGSKFYAGQNEPASEDAWIVQRLIAAGGVITGKTHLHPLAYGITGENPEYGDCVQPRDRRMLTGGSSSGAVASVQEGSALVAVGTDTGGSVRVPAALCGLAGYRASHGLIPEEICWKGGAHLAPSFDTLGLIFRDLRDGPVLGEAVFGLEQAAAMRNPRIGFVDEAFLYDCDDDVRAAWVAWGRRLATAGATLEPFETGFWSECKEIFTTIQASEVATIHKGNFSHFEPAIAERLVWGASVTGDELAALHLRLKEFQARMADLLERYDFLLLPCAPVSRLRAGEDQSGARARILRYTCPISMAGLPTVTLPGEQLARSAGEYFGTGMQLAGARLKDAQLLAFAAALSL